MRVANYARSIEFIWGCQIEHMKYCIEISSLCERDLMELCRFFNNWDFNLDECAPWISHCLLN